MQPETLSSYIDKVVKLESQLEDAMEKIHALEEENKSLREQLEKLEKKNRNLTRKNVDLKELIKIWLDLFEKVFGANEMALLLKELHASRGSKKIEDLSEETGIEKDKLMELINKLRSVGIVMLKKNRVKLIRKLYPK